MTIDVINTAGKKVETMTLPKAVFEAQVSEQVIAQAVRVYLANQHQGSKKVQTRGEVNRTGAKVWRQKGTGRARHGSRRAPIFVGGGVAFGPNPTHSPKITLNKKAKKAALVGGLSAQAKAQNIIVLDATKGFDGKTKTAEKIFAAISGYAHQSNDNITLVLPTAEKEILQAIKNLPGINITQTNRLNIFEILNSKKLILTKDAIKNLEITLGSQSKKKVTN